MRDSVTAEIIEMNYRDLVNMPESELKARYEDTVGSILDRNKEEVIIDLLGCEWPLSYLQTWEEFYPPHLRPELDWEE